MKSCRIITAHAQLYVTASISDTNSISMKEAMATGLPVLHIKDPLNAGQVVDGVNGFIYNNAEEMYALLKQYQAMTEEEKEALTISVVNSVKIFGCEALAKYLIGVYEKAIKGEAGKNRRKKEIKKRGCAMFQFGIMGAGNIASQFCDAVKRSGCAEVAAVASRTARQSKGFC